MTASSALRPTASSAVVAYTCHLAHELTYTCFHAKYFLCLSIPSSPAAAFRRQGCTSSGVTSGGVGRPSHLGLLHVYVLDFYFLDMIMWLHVSSIDFSNSSVGGRCNVDIGLKVRTARRLSTRHVPAVFPSLSCILALLLVYHVLSLSAYHTVQLLISLCSCLLLSRRT